MCYTGKCKYEIPLAGFNNQVDCTLYGKNIPKDAYCVLSENDSKIPMTEVEKMLIKFIDDWYDNHMKYYTDKQYNKGNFKKLVEKAKKMIEERNL